jgi:hypothetical protein
MGQIAIQLIRTAPQLLCIVAIVIFIIQALGVVMGIIEMLNSGPGSGVMLWLSLFGGIASAAFQPAILIAVAAAVTHLERIANPPNLEK